MSLSENIGARAIGSTRELGEALRAARTAQGLTQNELSEIAELSRTHLVAIEKGKTTERLEHVFRLVSLLGLDLVVVPRGSRRTS